MHEKLQMVLCVGDAVRSLVVAVLCMLSTYISFTKKPPRQLLSIKLKKFNLISSWNRHESEKSTWVWFFCQFCLRLYSWLLRQECPKFCRSQGNYNISNNIKQDSLKHSFSYSFYSSATTKGWHFKLRQQHWFLWIKEINYYRVSAE